MVIAGIACLSFRVEADMVDMFIQPEQHCSYRSVQYAEVELCAIKCTVYDKDGGIPAQIGRQAQKQKEKPEADLLPGFPGGIRSCHRVVIQVISVNKDIN